MAEFNYRNAYRLAIQTNRELHSAIEAYKTLLDAAKAEVARVYEENQKLKERVEYLEQIQEWQYNKVYMGDQEDDYDT